MLYSFIQTYVLINLQPRILFVTTRHFSIHRVVCVFRYTSLGSMENTKPNPKLEYKDEKGNTQYRPAYYLDDEQFERDGRK